MLNAIVGMNKSGKLQFCLLFSVHVLAFPFLESFDEHCCIRTAPRFAGCALSTCLGYYWGPIFGFNIAQHGKTIYRITTIHQLVEFKPAEDRFRN